jgi:hypothetical protein
MVFFGNAFAILLQRFEESDQGLLGILDGLLVAGAPAVASRQRREKGEITGLVRVEFYRECVGKHLGHGSILSDRQMVTTAGGPRLRGHGATGSRLWRARWQAQSAPLPTLRVIAGSKFALG